MKSLVFAFHPAWSLLVSEAMVVCENFLHKDEQVQFISLASKVCGPVHLPKPAHFAGESSIRFACYLGREVVSPLHKLSKTCQVALAMATPIWWISRCTAHAMADY
jgi:hypothetical protein